MKKKKFRIKGADSAIRMFAPKLVTIGLNILRMGPRIIVRSTIQLLRANLFTRIISCLTLFILDVVDLYRHRISKAQFCRNILLSLILIGCGTFGWNLGSKWILLEIFGSAVEIIGGLVGAGIAGALSSVAFDKACSKFLKSDAEQMRDIIRGHLSDLPDEEKHKIIKEISNSELKKMFACEDKDDYAEKLVNDIRES